MAGATSKRYIGASGLLAISGGHHAHRAAELGQHVDPAVCWVDPVRGSGRVRSRDSLQLLPVVVTTTTPWCLIKAITGTPTCSAMAARCIGLHNAVGTPYGKPMGTGSCYFP